jgi:hypothetical protein
MQPCMSAHVFTVNMGGINYPQVVSFLSNLLSNVSEIVYATITGAENNIYISAVLCANVTGNLTPPPPVGSRAGGCTGLTNY